MPAYTAFDLRVAWRPRADTELSLTGRNLFDGGHGEFGPVATRIEVGASVLAKVEVRF